MFTIYTGGGARSCDGLTRRDFLRAGALTAGGLGLADLLRARAAEAGGFVRDRAVVFLWLGGGPSQFETFDPKMAAPAEVRSYTGEVKTTLPGVTFGGTFPLLAQRMKRLAIVRSFTTTTADHATGPKTVLAGLDRGRDRQEPSMGAVYARLAGATHPTRSLPRHVMLTAPEIAQEFRYQKSWMADGAGAGRLPSNFNPFHPDGAISGGKGGTPDFQPPPLLENMRLRLSASRLEDRRALLDQMDRLSRSVDALGELGHVDRFRRQAYDVLRNGVADAFDLKKEPARTVERYDTARFSVGHRKGGFRPSTLGKQMLLARRLCEAGAGFVLVQNSGWDMHDDGNNVGIKAGFEMLGPEVDHAVSVFLDDLHERGLSEKVLLVVTGEMGRTPRKQGRGGRNHWGGLAPLLLAGGGLKMGQVVGDSDARGGEPRTGPYKPAHLMATVLHHLLDVGRLRLQEGLPRDLVQRVESGRPIAELV